ncbi:MAG: hypothetical protein QOI02_325 [Actinomycetota bacterium]|nr:hypothetical protein [Actinomycetota bacterium]
MSDIAALVRSLDGMAQKQQLVRRGARDLDLTRAVKHGDVIRARQGWYTTLPERDPRVRAVRVGGRLTGISAVSALGGWVLDEHPLHVSLPTNASRSRSQWDRHKPIAASNTRGVIRHWDPPDVSDHGTTVAVSLTDALIRVVVDEPLEVAVAALDWATHTRMLDLFDFEALLLKLPTNRRYIGRWVDPECESLPESLARTRLRMRGHSVRGQVPLRTGERIDLVVDECVAIETDGEQFHLASFERDRRKDAEIAIAGLHGLRPSARMVFHEWPLVELAVETAVATRRPGLRFGNSGVRIPARRNIRINSALRRAGIAQIPEFPKAPSLGEGQRGIRAAPSG